MADSGIITMTDDGEALLGSFVNALGIIYWIDTASDETDALSSGPPRRVMHAGWVALASGDNASPSTSLTLDVLQITWWAYFDHESNGRQFYPGWANIDRIIWHIPVGGVSKVQLFW